ncbi:P-loop containing nucleoside triphosphate hydrolase protein [Tuber brumale]|nr:P-loop containing nucleoside triphosphate hydrolase protein [Tuber brumale]
MTSPRTRIKYMTDGMLLREALVDPLLSRYSVVMIDEAHERTLSTDVLLGILKKIRRRREDLRIVVSSATLQAEEFARFFGDEGESGEKKRDGGGDDGDGDEEKKELTKIISLEGRCYPVDVLYLEEPTENYVEKAVQTVFDIHLKEGEGDILLFLTGREEIETAISMIRERAEDLHPRAPQLLPLPLYAGLPSDEQLAVFDPAPENHRKVIVSTNIAEASVTIENIVFVIDCGFVKLRTFDPRTGIEALSAAPVSRASATQRAGRAGRTKAGKCFRLYTQRAFNDIMAEMGIPEIQRSNLAPVLLQLKALGIDNVVRFDFITPPPSELMVRALELLFSLGALDDYARLTKPLGLRMAEMPVDPMTAKILLNSVTFRCTDQILSIAAMTSVQNVFITHEGSKKPAESAKPFAPKANKPNAAKWCKDHYLNFRALSRAVSVREQLRRYIDKFNLRVSGEGGGGTPTAEGIRRCLTTGYFAHAARMQPDGSFRSVNGMQLWAHPSSVMFNRKADWVVFHEVVETGKKTFIRDVTVIEKDWLLEYAPGFYQLRK